MDMIGRIRHLHRRRYKSEREIARITGLSRKHGCAVAARPGRWRDEYRRGEQANKLSHSTACSCRR